MRKKALPSADKQPTPAVKISPLRNILPWKGDPFREILRKLILIIALCTFIGSSGVLLYQLVILPYQTDKTTADLRVLYPGNQTIGSSQKSGTASQPAAQEAEETSLEKFTKLLQVNPDIKGWINVPNTKIDYPVLQSSPEDPEFYLYRDYNKQNTKYGSIFLDAQCSVDGGEKNLILYGHHMHDGRMFANLMNYSDLDFYKSTPVFTFDTIHDESVWKVFAVIKTNTLYDQGEPFRYIRTSFSNASDFLDYIYQVRVRSLIDSPVDITDDDQIITLSTCSYEFADFRTVVFARKVRPGEDSAVDIEKSALAQNPVMPDCWYEKYGGSAPQVTSFASALKNGEIHWYKPAAGSD